MSFADLMNPDFQARNAAYLERSGTQRRGSASCALRGDNPLEQCCDGVNLQCFGCSEALLDQNMKCANQPTAPSGQLVAPNTARDCYCDSSCIMFNDCCDDHPEICKRLYSTEAPETPKPTTKATTTTPPTTTTKKTTKKTTTKKTTTQKQPDFNPECRPEKFAKSLINIGNRDYKLNVSWSVKQKKNN